MRPTIQALFWTFLLWGIIIYLIGGWDALRWFIGVLVLLTVGTGIGAGFRWVGKKLQIKIND